MLVAIDYHSFWYDEAVGDQLTAHGSYFDIALGRARDNGLPPLHYLTDKFSSDILGTDEAGHRTLPAIFGIATILFTGILGRKLQFANVGIVAGLACRDLTLSDRDFKRVTRLLVRA